MASKESEYEKLKGKLADTEEQFVKAREEAAHLRGILEGRKAVKDGPESAKPEREPMKPKRPPKRKPLSFKPLRDQA